MLLNRYNEYIYIYSKSIACQQSAHNWPIDKKCPLSVCVCVCMSPHAYSHIHTCISLCTDLFCIGASPTGRLILNVIDGT